MRRLTGSRGKRLESWKEIGSYLGKRPRTARKWEKTLGLPVRRLGEGKRPRIVAYTDEIDRWLEKKENGPGQPRRRVGVIVGGLAAAAGLSVAVAVLRPSPPFDVCRPSSLKVEGFELKALDSEEVPCWSVTVPGLDEASYRDPGGNDRNALSQKSLVDDIDEDGHNEVLVIVMEGNYREKTTRLACFNEDSSLRWEYQFGRAQSWGERRFGSSYVGMFVQLHRSGDHNYVLGVARNELYFPVQIVLLEPRSGEPVEEWGHPGHIQDVVQFDLDGDGADEILLGGENNPGDGHGHPSLMILAPNSAGSASDRPAAVPFWGRRDGLYEYLLFELPDVFPETSVGAHVSRIDVVQGKVRCRVGRHPNDWIYYTLGSPDLALKEVVLLGVMGRHEELEREGTLDHSAGDTELQSWSQIRTFDYIPDANSPEVAELFSKGGQ